MCLCVSCLVDCVMLSDLRFDVLLRLRGAVWLGVLFVRVSCFGVCVAQSCLCLVCVLSDVVWFVAFVVCVRVCVLVSFVVCFTCVVCDLLCGNA